MLALGSPAAAPNGLATCQDPEPFPRLDAYHGAKSQNRFYVDVRWSGAEFVPVETIAMPRHHSSRLEWTNRDRWPSLAQGYGGVLRFRGRHLTSTIEKVPGQHRWWATYRVELEGVCIVRAASGSTPPEPTAAAPPATVQSIHVSVQSPQYAEPESVTVTFGRDGARAAYSGLHINRGYHRFKSTKKQLSPAQARALLDLVQHHQHALKACSAKGSSGIRYVLQITVTLAGGGTQRLSMSYAGGKRPSREVAAIMDALGSLFGKKLREVRRYD